MTQMYSRLRLDELFQELNDSEDQLTTLIKQIDSEPCYAPYIKEAFTPFDWVDLPIEDMSKFVSKWGAEHWSVAPVKALSKTTIDLIEKVIKNPAMDLTRRKQKTIFFLSNLCNEESEAVYLALTKNLVSKWDKINSSVVYQVFPEIETKE